MKLSSLALGLLLPALASPAFALNIVLTNDDGLSSNVKALYEALKAKGHDVIVSVPCTGQSGMGAAVKYFTPLTPLTSACLNNAAAIGDPGAGAMTRSGFTGGDYYYVNGTPVMATMYGLDVVAQARWGKAPDVVLSGPNEGQNVGSIVIGSGTVSNAQFASARGIPAIALSADTTTADNTNLANSASTTVASLSITLLEALQAKAGTGALLPTGMSLNVNFPKDLSSPVWAFSRIGTYSVYDLHFVSDLSKDSIAAAYGITYPYPGVTISYNTAAATAAQAEDESVLYTSKITVTAMQPAYDQRVAGQQWLRLRLRSLLQ